MRHNLSSYIEGILLVDKPSGLTSHDVVDVLREKLGIKKIGHSGTLDPVATGLLILLIGKYTKKQQHFQKLDKVYEGTIKFGIETDTWDIEGKILNRVNGNLKITEKEIKSTVKLLEGNINQIIPPYSAVKYKGQTLYKLARKNKTVPTLNRVVNVKWLSYDYNPDENLLYFKIKCSSGTYLRSIAYQMGQILGCGGIIHSLRRLKIGNFKVENALKLKELETSDLNYISKYILK